jgi:hypothetical protein
MVFRSDFGAWVTIGAMAGIGLAAARPARAQASSSQDTLNEEAARELASKCSQSLDKQDFASAYDQCSRAEKLYPSREKPPALLVFLARSCRGIGKFVCARDAYTRVATMELRPGLSPEAKKAQEAFIEEGRRERVVVAEKIGRVTLAVRKAIPGMKVMLDDTSIDAAAFDVKLPVDPGSHVVTAEATGFEPYEYRFSIAEKEDATAPVSLTPLIKEERPRPPPGPSTGRQVATWSSFGIGAAGLAVGTIFGVQWLSKTSSLSNSCPNKTCPPGSFTSQQIEADNKDLAKKATASGIGFGVAGAGIIVGTILLLTSPKAEAPKTGVAIRPEVGFGSLGVSGSF